MDANCICCINGVAILFEHLKIGRGVSYYHTRWGGLMERMGVSLVSDMLTSALHQH